MIWKRAPKVFALAVLIAAATHSHGMGQERSGKQLVEQCKSTDGAPCSGYLRQAIERIGEGEGYCLPNEYDIGQVREAFLAWASDYPEELDKSAVNALKAALIEQFPCEE